MKCLFQRIYSQAFGERGEEKVLLDHEPGLCYKIKSVKSTKSWYPVARIAHGTSKYSVNIYR